jgi:ubiquinone/menaquinone biosynthesis C-methylase UbiE
MGEKRVTGPHPPICDYEGSDYQAQFWERGGRAYEDQAEALALKKLLPRAGKLMLELGAGAGRNTLRYSGFEQIVLLDYSLSQLQLAMQRLGKGPRYVYVAADIYQLPFVEGLFDAATMIRTLHHMADPLSALKQVHSALQPGAVFILEFANKHNLKAILRYYARRQDWSPFSLESVEFEELNFDFHPQMIRKWLKEAGFMLQRERAVSYFRLGIFKRSLPLGLLNWMEGWLQPTGSWCQLSPSIFSRSQVVGSNSPAKAGAFFKCPACAGTDLKADGSKLSCMACARDWPIREGIYDFRLQPG